MQVDGEPWVQGPGELVILKSALKVRYVKVILIYVYLCEVIWRMKYYVITFI